EGESLCDEASRTGHFRTIAPAILDDEVVFEASPSVPRPDPARPGVTVPWVRTGAVLTATFAVEAELDVDETSVSLGGLELDPQDETGTVWSVVLDGNEGDGLKDLDLRLVDPWGNVTRERREGVVRFDFTPPAADCALLPPLANAMQPVTFDVFATETLAGPPVVTSSDDRMGLPYQGSAGNQHRFSVIGVPGDNLRYTLTATATDLVGNAQEGPSLCSDEQRTGEIIGRGPALRDGEDVVITATPSVDVDGTPWVRAGAHVTVSFPVVEALDPETTVVTLSGLELLWENGTTWGATLTGFEGDGPKTLDARLRDVAGNELRVQRGDVVRFDFTAPVAECVLFPQAAKADDEVVLQVFASEPLAGEDGPTVTPLEPGIDTRLLAAAGSQYDVAIDLPTGTDLPVYTVLVTGTDLVGNPQAGDSLCELADRMGSYRGIPPALDPGGPILTVEPPAYEQPLGVPWVRTGALVMVDVPTLAPIDEDATQVTLSGLVLDPVGGQRWVTTLTGGEGDGLKDLRLQLVDDAGNLTPEGRNGVIRFDFTPPVADCALQPVSANGDQQVTFDVFASEALATEPTVTSDESGVVPVFQATTGSQHRYRVMGTEGENLAYRLTATGTDLAGNPQAGASFCDVEERQGEILARRPVLLDATLAAAPSVDVDSVPVVRAGATVSVRVRTADPIDVKRTSVSLSGLELTPPDPVGDATDTTWTVPLTGAEGDGLKDLRLRLFDAAGNITDPPVQPGVIRFDFTAPVADCVLTPTLANSTQAITFDVFTSEALDGPPRVTSSVLEVQATYDALASTGNQHRFVVQGAPDQNHAYELTVTATDVAGNPQQGASLCSSSSRTGQIVGRGPQLLDVVFAADPEVRVDDAFWVGAGQWIEVTFTVVEDLDPLTTVVNVSGTP
ncbi:MAG: hypothetical protein KC656_19485, partial [Myxococcales bacterium]|nr:hypothetical protein [Myxococcales bacterium]